MLESVWSEGCNSSYKVYINVLVIVTIITEQINSYDILYVTSWHNPCWCKQPLNCRRTCINTQCCELFINSLNESLSCQITLCQNRESDSHKHLRSGFCPITKNHADLRTSTATASRSRAKDARHIGKYVHDNRVSIWRHRDPLYINRAGVLFMNQITLVQAEEAAHTPALGCDMRNPNHTGQVQHCPRLPLPTLLPIIIIYSRIKGSFISKPMNNECHISKFNCPELNDSR